MDKSLFTNPSGKLIRISTSHGVDWSFIPKPPPTKWKIPETVWPKLAKAREELARLDGMGRHIPNHEILLRPLQRREALRSSSLEGTYATPEELLLFEINPDENPNSTPQVTAWREVFNYGRALKLGRERLDEEFPLSLRLINELHEALLRNVRGQDKTPGNFRRMQNQIGIDARFIPSPPNELIPALDSLEKFFHADSSIDPLVRCFIAHYQFETIHPFADGNGRVGRVLLSLMIYKYLKLSAPWLYLSAFFEKYKNDYIDLLFNVSAVSDWEAWINFCLDATISQATDSINRIDKLIEIKDKYLSLVAGSGGSARLHSIVENLFNSTAITIPMVTEMVSVSYPTARSDINKLVELNILRCLDGKRRPNVYYANEIVDIAYTE